MLPTKRWVIINCGQLLKSTVTLSTVFKFQPIPSVFRRLFNKGGVLMRVVLEFVEMSSSWPA